jgi:hypothetical protein
MFAAHAGLATQVRRLAQRRLALPAAASPPLAAGAPSSLLLTVRTRDCCRACAPQVNTQRPFFALSGASWTGAISTLATTEGARWRTPRRAATRCLRARAGPRTPHFRANLTHLRASGQARRSRACALLRACYSGVVVVASCVLLSLPYSFTPLRVCPPPRLACPSAAHPPPLPPRSPRAARPAWRSAPLAAQPPPLSHSESSAPDCACAQPCT